MKLKIKAINKDYQRLINQWIERHAKYNEIVNIISMKNDMGQVTESLERKEENIYSSILDIESELPKKELENARKEFIKFYGYEA
tara:strand:+ start:4948 stop:5202 length:255 start_codon:yes stop_codon:yes gene_type:complete